MMTYGTVVGVVLAAVELAGVVSGAVETGAVTGIVDGVDGEGGLPGDVVAGGAVNLRRGKKKELINAIHFICKCYRNGKQLVLFINSFENFWNDKQHFDVLGR